MKRTLVAVLFFSALLGIWQAIVSAGIYSPVLLPAPTEVGRYLLRALSEGDLISAIITTSKRLFFGYLVGCLIGLPLGLLTARSSISSSCSSDFSQTNCYSPRGKTLSIEDVARQKTSRAQAAVLAAAPMALTPVLRLPK